ncbi:hypothetical protein EON65_10985 [archaeon]|nr:MAG: hypothetical protein EON65_10985 [archaeon]
MTQLKSRLQSHHNSHRKEWQPSVSTALELLAMYEDTMKASTSTGDEGASVELIKILLKDLVTSEVSRLIQRAREGDSMLRVRASGVLARVQNICGVLTISLDMKGKDSAEDWIVKPSEDMGRDLEAYASCLESVVTDPLPTLFGDTVYMGMNLRL